MPTNDPSYYKRYREAHKDELREYHRNYAKRRRFLYRLEHPRKTPGVKPGTKFLNRKPRVSKQLYDEIEKIQKKFNWSPQ